jgi:NAD+ synthase
MSEQPVWIRADEPSGVPELDLIVVRRVLVEFIRNEVLKLGLERVVLGLSGGIDSAVACVLAAAALGPESVLALCMPYRSSSPQSLADAQLVAECAGVDLRVADITPQIDAYFREQPEATKLERGNKMARERMAVLYDHSARRGALVLGTSNKTELLLGYGTIHGDMASALNPIGDLYKTQLRDLAAFIGVPRSVIAKPPSADLWAGQTDEEEMGFSYAAVDAVLCDLVDRRCSRDAVIARVGDADLVVRIEEMIRRSQFKRALPIIAKVSHRTVGRDFRYARDWGV